ncbi:restriction endonuclease subunit S [Glaesserella parasuis]|nr:restriction endonuclease subunit S [Glaesserella parasuis]MCT8631951.1 restriction endonuclease subunit S [Glaesserella parasuis]MCT8842346.1 restriction endonuclease subunit S [Glaesserella parasuis]MDE4024294.1 restriction endonuclease subunit S [Glaesserella parasuis]MDG6233219.1 restriction endonuclease subunit S [Glaesserella parasuis]MDG6252947.1 restriction endonuclease subunit S [Glaesserella parasuis]
MSSWKEYKLGEIATFYNGRAYKNTEFKVSGTPIVRIQNLTGEGKIVYSDLNLDENKYIDYGDLIYAWSATFGPYIWKGEKSIYHYHIWKIICNEELLDKKYFYYKLKQISDNLKDSGGNGSIFVHITKAFMENFKVKIPSLNEQKRVSSILAYLDEKIQLNTQINQTLEQIAQTIFKSWFIDFDPVHAKANALASGQTTEQATQAAMTVISGKNTQELHRLQTANPEQYQQLWEIAEAFPSGVDEEGVPRGWEQTTLSEVCSMKNGYAFKSSDWTEEGIPVIKIGSVKPMIVEVDGNGFVDEEHSVLHSEFLLTEGDIVVGLTGYVGEVGRIPQGRTAMLNQRVAKFIPNKLNEQQDYYSFVYCLVRDKSFKAFAETNAKGSAQANISTKELLNYSIILASSEIQMKFESLIKPLLDKILVNSGNNENLSKVRDLLLPKLLSGELNGLPEKTI